MLFRLLQARHDDDPMQLEERRSFAARLGVPLDEVVPYNVIDAPADAGAWCEGMDGVLVGGSGEYGVLDGHAWVNAFIDTLAEVAASGPPLFASCFGFQALVVAMGGEVVTDEARAEVGTYRITLTDEGRADPLFGGTSAEFDAQQGHKDSAARLPSGVTHLARSERCRYQAIRIGDRPAYATQFHPELTGAENLARFERYYELYRKHFDPAEAERIRTTHRASPESNALLESWRALVAGA